MSASTPDNSKPMPPDLLESETIDTHPPKSSTDNDVDVTKYDTTVQSASSSAEWPRRMGDYELLAEIARGGMGVVYKARQVSLDRIVALKMILGGEHAGAEHHARFKTEAEAIARLQHPHIVQIHEIGELDQLPYFSLEYCSGGSLEQKLQREPMSAHAAAALVEVLARAVQAAHNKGVIHRDLKPANVLLSEDGKPKITDFGLAKKLEEDGRTVTGAVMGTPSYMAPEQARGHKEQIGPASDTYALGAILYKCLTGKPPFEAPTAWEIIQKVLTSEPAPLSQQLTNVPRDLETICLKAMAKEPRHRYESALALAQDLERFLADQPILARREGLMRKLRRKARRNRTSVLSLLLAILTTAGITGYFIYRDAENWQDKQVDQTVVLERDLDEALSHLELSEESLGSMEARWRALERHAPVIEQSRKKAIYDRFEQKIDHLYAERRIAPNERVRRIKGALDVLAKRDAARAAKLRARFQSRERPEEEAFARYDKDDIASTSVSPLSLTKVACPVNARMTAVFVSNWSSVSRLGLTLNAESEKKGYFFTLRPVEHATFAESRRRGGLIAMRIARNGRTLRELVVPAKSLPEADLKLEARRTDEWLTMSIAEEGREAVHELSFRDPFPLRGNNRGFYGTLWNGAARLKSVQGFRRLPPLSPHPMQSADSLFQAGEHKKALDAYQQLDSAGAVELRQEARCKQGICLMELEQYAEAERVFDEVKKADGDHWPWIAQFYLLLAYRWQDKVDAVANELEALLRESPMQLERITRLVPEDGVDELWRFLFDKLGAQSALSFAKPRIALLELLVRDVGNSALHPRNRGLMKMALSYGYTKSNETAKALGVLQQLSHEDPEATACLRDAHLCPVHVYCWGLRNQGNAAEALDVVNRQLGRYPDLLHERARCYVALNQWDKAEQDLIELVQRQNAAPEEVTYVAHANVRIMLGFVREHRGDEAGAVQAWKEALFKNYLAGGEKPKRAGGLVAGFKGAERCLIGLMAGSLSGDLSTADVRQLIREAQPLLEKLPLRYAPGDKNVFPLRYWRRIWQTPEGRDLARQIVFQQAPVTRCVQMILEIHTVEGIYEGAFGKGVTPHQKKVVGSMVRDTFDEYLSGKVAQSKIAFFAGKALYVWTDGFGSGVAPRFSWSLARAELRRELRAPMAYVFGRRYLVLNKPKVATAFFHDVLKDAKPDSALAGLVQAELDLMNAPKRR